MKKILNWNDNFQVDIVTRALRNNEVVIGNSDTVLGLLSDISEASFEALNKIKRRSQDNPFLFLIESSNKIGFFSDVIMTPNLKNLIKNCWPGPATLCFKAKENTPEYLKSKENTVALRVPNHYGLLYLLSNFTGLFSTSANKSGEPMAKCIKDLDPSILEQINYVITNTGTDIECAGKPSTILYYTGNKIKILREGAYPIEELEKFYGEKFIK